MLCDSESVPLAICTSGAQMHDIHGLEELLDSQQITRPYWATSVNLCLDAGYISPDTQGILANHGMTGHIRPRKQEKAEKQAGKKARRWAVERSHSWQNRYRRLLIRWEKRHELYLAWIHLACAITTLATLFPG